METDEYRRAYQHAFTDFQNQMNLRNRTVPRTTKDATNQASTSGTKAVEIKSSAEAKGKERSAFNFRTVWTRCKIRHFYEEHGETS